MKVLLMTLALALLPPLHLGPVSAEPCPDQGNSLEECDECPSPWDFPASDPQNILYECTHKSGTGDATIGTGSLNRLLPPSPSDLLA
jgi:hypothetical protein